MLIICTAVPDRALKEMCFTKGKSVNEILVDFLNAS